MQHIELLVGLTGGKDLLEHVFGGGDVGLNKDFVGFPLNGAFLLIVGAFAVNLSDLLANLRLGLLSLLLGDIVVVQVAYVRQEADGEELIVTFSLALIVVRVILHVDDLEVRVVQLADIFDGPLHVADEVLAEGEHVEVLQMAYVLDLVDLVRVEREVSQIQQGVESFDFLDQIERQIKPREVDHRFEVLDLADDVVVELQLGQLRHAVEVVDANDVLVAELEVRQRPEWIFVVVKDLVLLVVLDHVLLDERVVDDGRLDGLLLFLGLRHNLQGLGGFRIHALSLEHCGVLLDLCGLSHRQL